MVRVQIFCGNVFDSNIHLIRVSFVFSLSQSVPVVVMGWIEAVSCDAGLVHVGGHVWYDAIIPISVLVYAAVALSRPQSSSADALVKKAS